MNDDLPDYGSGERGKFTWKDGEMIKVTEVKSNQAHYVITDEIDPIESNASFDKPVFTSKSKLRRHYKAHGFKETGGDHLQEKKSFKNQKDKEREIREEKELVEAAYMDVKYGRVPLSEQEKQQIEEEKRIWGKNYKVKSPL